MKASRFARFLTGAGMIVSLAGAATVAGAARKAPAPVLEVWPGQRVVMLLPLKLGEGWNADPALDDAILGQAEYQLRMALLATRKFSVIQPYRFSPILQRAVQDRRITQPELDSLVENPSVETATVVLEKLGFDRKPMIADFTLEEVRVTVPPKPKPEESEAKDSGKKTMDKKAAAKNASAKNAGAKKTTAKKAAATQSSDKKRSSKKSDAKSKTDDKEAAPEKAVQIRVTGKLYDVGDRVAVHSPVVTSDSIMAGGNPLQSVLLASADAVTRAIAVFVEPPSSLDLLTTRGPGARTVAPATPAGEMGGTMAPPAGPVDAPAPADVPVDAPAPTDVPAAPATPAAPPADVPAAPPTEAPPADVPAAPAPPAAPPAPFGSPAPAAAPAAPPAAMPAQ